MNEYVIITDSAADLELNEARELGVEIIPLSLTMEGKTYLDYPDRRELDPKDFYAQLRGGAMSTTAAVNMVDAREAAEPFLKEGKDVLFLAFSSGLSATCQNTRLAAQELSEEYPDRTIAVVDTLAASRGQGLLVWLAAQKKAAGASLEEVRAWVEDNKLHLCHWFTVDDLHFLKRGGRISAATAMLGTMLAIKPVLHVDDEGRLVSMSKARGREASIDALIAKAKELGENLQGQTMMICHGDCPEDAEYLANKAKTELGAAEVKIGYTGPVIGSHSGPGTLALFFLGKNR